MRFQVSYRHTDGTEKQFHVQAKSKNRACRIVNREIELRYEDHEDEAPESYSIVVCEEVV